MAALTYETNHRPEWKRRWVRITAWFGLFAIAVAFGSLYSFHLKYQAEARLEGINNTLREQNAELVRLDEVLEGTAELNPAQRELLKRISGMGLPRYLSISEALYRLERRLPNDIKLVSYSQNRMSGSVQLVAILPASSQLSQLVDDLAKDESFKSVRVYRSQGRKSGRKEVVLKLSVRGAGDE